MARSSTRSVSAPQLERGAVVVTKKVGAVQEIGGGARGTRSGVFVGPPT
jgi:hypothetical protein